MAAHLQGEGGKDSQRDLGRVARALLWAAWGEDAYLVGGAVRSLLLGRRPVDIDVLSPRAEHFARRARELLAAEGLEAAVVRLHGRPETWRVALGWMDIDVSQPLGRDVRGDLLARDFTVNAMAVPLEDAMDAMMLAEAGAPEEAPPAAELAGRLIDPLGGLRDLRAGLVRLCSGWAPVRDPVRVVRAYRLAAELPGTIVPTTRSVLREMAPRARLAPAQRVGRELLRLAALPLGGFWLARAAEDEPLVWAVPELKAGAGMEQGGYHHLDVLGHTCEALRILDRIAAGPGELFARAGQAVAGWLAAAENAAALRAACLLHDVGKPGRRFVDEEGRIWFRNHEKLGEQMAGDILRALGWPRPVRKLAAKMVGLHMRPLQLARQAARGEAISARAVARLARAAADALEGLAVLCAADLLATRGPATDPKMQRRMLQELDGLVARAIEARERVERVRIITGHDLMRELGLRPGPVIGRLLRAVEQAAMAGEVQTREQALELARRLLREGGAP